MGGAGEVGWGVGGSGSPGIEDGLALLLDKLLFKLRSRRKFRSLLIRSGSSMVEEDGGVGQICEEHP